MQTAEFSSPLKLTDSVGTLANSIAENWLIGMRESNPGILDMFHERDILPYRDHLPWSGEFAGKYITGAYYVYQLTHHEQLRTYMLGFLDELLTCIDGDGYVGCYQKQCRLTGAYSQTPGTSGATWDAWSHYHIMFGLYLWHLETGDERLWQALLRIADFFLTHFYDGKCRLASIGFSQMNLAPYHIFAILAAKTGDKRYLVFARQVEKDIATASGNYLGNARSGMPFYRGTMPRWEAIHSVMGIASMFDATGDEQYRRAAVQIFRSILSTDIHNTGGFSTDEQAVGTPYRNGSIELCAVTAFNAFACQLLLLTGESDVADFLELSYYNAVLGSFSPSGRWSTYNTPMEGLRLANTQVCNFQSRAGTPQLNCCSASSARAIGTLYEWAVTEQEETVFLNYYGSFSCRTAKGLYIKVQGIYPACGSVCVSLQTDTPSRIALRIPGWSKKTLLHIGQQEQQPQPGKYCFIDLPVGYTELTLQFDFSPYVLHGQDACKGKASVYVGPVLYGCEPLLNSSTDFHSLPALPTSEILAAVPEKDSTGRILLRIGQSLTLCDFWHLGQTGGQYKTWFTIAE